MPIDSIISQPGSNSIAAAYRPIILQVAASAAPPVVYCDIYFNNVFYKTIGKTQSKESSGTTWEFDIQDAAQEYLGKYIAPNGGQDIEAASPLVASAFCKFRSSSFDSEGFIQQDGTPPVQATSDTGASSGSGTSSNTFYVVNSTLQHEDNQDLAAHLNAYKNRTWDTTTYPLTHRPDHYKVCAVDSDYFPILSDKVPTKLRIHYIPKGGTDYTVEDSESVCIAVKFVDKNLNTVEITPSLPDGIVGQGYLVVIALAGTPPFSIDDSTGPGWMSIDISGSNLIFSGTPDAADTNISVSVTVSNCSGGNTKVLSSVIDVTACAPTAIPGAALPDATAGAPYNVVKTLSGTPPFTLGSVTKPAWMNITVFGNHLIFSGTPANSDVDTGLSISADVTNACGTDTFSDTIDVIATQNFILDASYNMSIDSVTGSGIPSLPSTGINAQQRGHQTGMSGSYSIVLTGTPVLPSITLGALVNGSLYGTPVHVTAAGTYSLTIVAAEADTVSISIYS
jgi:hypothetical protein